MPETELEQLLTALIDYPHNAMVEVDFVFKVVREIQHKTFLDFMERLQAQKGVKCFVYPDGSFSVGTGNPLPKDEAIKHLNEFPDVQR